MTTTVTITITVPAATAAAIDQVTAQRIANDAGDQVANALGTEGWRANKPVTVTVA